MELKTDDQQVPVQTPTTEKKPRGRPRKINKVVSINTPSRFIKAINSSQ